MGIIINLKALVLLQWEINAAQQKKIKTSNILLDNLKSKFQ